MTKRFRQDPLKNWFGRQRSLELRKDNSSITIMILQTKKFKLIANSNAADSGVIALTDEPLPC